jgi:DUF971 family protein
MTNNVPSKIQLHRKSKVLELSYPLQSSGELEKVELRCEYLRVYSPSAEVKGHGPGQEVLQTGKRNVTINQIESIGNYAIKLTFSDGHDTGIFSWDYLRQLADNYETNWQDYLKRLHDAGATRDPDVAVIQFKP